MFEKIRYKKYDKSQRSTFSYWFHHWLNFNLVAIELKVWKPKYLLHDIEKPWLKLILRDYSKVQKWHRTHNSHHLEYNGPKDYEAMVIDWECSRYSKTAAPRTAIEESQYKLNDGTMAYKDYCAFISTALRMGLEK